MTTQLTSLRHIRRE